jgi:hypothetical protein
MGSAIKMAEFRAAEDALRRIYLKRRHVYEEECKLPSDTLCAPGVEWATAEGEAEYFGDDAVEYQSSGRSGKLAQDFERQPWAERDRLAARPHQL